MPERDSSPKAQIEAHLISGSIVTTKMYPDLAMYPAGLRATYGDGRVIAWPWSAFDCVIAPAGDFEDDSES